jgi:SPP1 family predicted phage head-tail adaptor
MNEPRTYIGKLDTPIQIMRAVSTTTSTGERQQTLEQLCRPWAHVKETGGDENAEGSIRHTIRRSYVVRYRSDIAVDMFVIDRGVTYDITHIKHIGRRDRLELIVQGHE